MNVISHFTICRNHEIHEWLFFLILSEKIANNGNWVWNEFWIIKMFDEICISEVLSLLKRFRDNTETFCEKDLWLICKQHAQVSTGVHFASLWLTTSKMAEENAIDLLINEVFPAEILKIILEWLDIKSLVNARLTCKHWKRIIDNCDIMEKALSKILKSNKLTDFAG